jgi:hypothetical protein
MSSFNYVFAFWTRWSNDQAHGRLDLLHVILDGCYSAPLFLKERGREVRSTSVATC